MSKGPTSGDLPRVYPPFYWVSELEKEGKERKKKRKEEDWGGTLGQLYNK